MILSDIENKNARDLLHLPSVKPSNITPPVKFDPSKRSITLFMPGFDKSEIKLYQVCLQLDQIKHCEDQSDY